MKRINPYKLFVGSFIPNWLLAREELSQGAKLCYARLAQYAGDNGAAWPKHELLAAEIGVTDRQVRTYLSELAEHKLIEWERTGNSNQYYFLVHEWMTEDRKSPDRKKTSDHDRKKTSDPYKENQEKRIKEKEMRARVWDAMPPQLQTPRVEAALDAYCTMRRSVRWKPWVDVTVKRQVAAWSAFHADELAEALEIAATNQHQGVFPKKKSGRQEKAGVPPPLVAEPRERRVVSTEERKRLREQLRTSPGAAKLLHSILDNEPESWRHSNELHKISE